MKIKENIYIGIIRSADILFLPFVIIASMYFKLIRMYGITMFANRMPLTRKILMKIGIFPIAKHYYDPIFDYGDRDISIKRKLPGIEYNISGQLAYLEKFHYQNELKNFPKNKTNTREFYYHNESYPPGDSEYLYSMIRSFKPRKILEIGSGNSTLMAINAIKKNESEDSSYTCDHTCIEPYEAGWLEKTGVNVIRELLENIDKNQFQDLQENDILFIDSSHIIRPGGDVLT